MLSILVVRNITTLSLIQLWLFELERRTRSCDIFYNGHMKNERGIVVMTWKVGHVHQEDAPLIPSGLNP